MSNLITGTHLIPEQLDGRGITEELNRFGEWAGTVDFQDLEPQVKKCKKCGHKDREQKLRPVLEGLGYQDKLHLIKYQVLRVVSRSYIEAGADAYLIPVRIEQTASAFLSDPSNSPELVKLTIGQKVFFNKPIIIEPGMIFLLVTAQ